MYVIGSLLIDWIGRFDFFHDDLTLLKTLWDVVTGLKHSSKKSSSEELSVPDGSSEEAFWAGGTDTTSDLSTVAGFVTASLWVGGLTSAGRFTTSVKEELYYVTSSIT